MQQGSPSHGKDLLATEEEGAFEGSALALLQEGRERGLFFSVFFYLLTLFYPDKLLLPGGRGGLPWRIFSKLLTAETFFIFSNSSS